MSAMQSTALPWMLFPFRRMESVLQKIKPLDFLVLLFAFFYGNVFVITFSTMNWGVFLISFIVYFLEFYTKIIYFLFYSKKEPTKKMVFFSFKPLLPNISKINKKRVLLLLTTLKRGFLLGFFVEAFKVGS